MTFDQWYKTYKLERTSGYDPFRSYTEAAWDASQQDTIERVLEILETYYCDVGQFLKDHYIEIIKKEFEVKE